MAFSLPKPVQDAILTILLLIVVGFGLYHLVVPAAAQGGSAGRCGIGAASLACPVAPEAQSIMVVGDSIGLGTGRKLCQMVRFNRLPYECKVVARERIPSRTIVPMIENRANIVVISACSNDPGPKECERNVRAMLDRVKRGASVVFLVPAKPAWAPALIHRLAVQANKEPTPHADVGTVTFTTGRDRVHPRDYERVAFDTLLLAISFAATEGSPSK